MTTVNKCISKQYFRVNTFERIQKVREDLVIESYIGFNMATQNDTNERLMKM